MLWSLAHAPPSLGAILRAPARPRRCPRLRRVALRNLELAYPEKTGRAANASLIEVFRSIARLLVRFRPLSADQRTEHFQLDSLRGPANISRRRSRPARGVLFATAHLGNWELSAFAHGIDDRADAHRGAPARQSARSTRWWSSAAQLSGNRLIEKKDAARAILARSAAE